MLVRDFFLLLYTKNLEEIEIQNFKIVTEPSPVHVGIEFFFLFLKIFLITLASIYVGTKVEN